MKIKRGIATLCIFSMCLTLCMTTAFAQDINENQDYNVFSYYEIAAGLVPGRSVAPMRGPSNIVCVMRIYSDPGSGIAGSINKDLGHTFLTFLNTSTANITVGRHTVAPNKMVSIGKFGRFKEYDGAFYNAETNRKERLGWYAIDRSIYMELTASQLSTVSTYLKNHQAGYLEFGDNCACYAAKAWNSVLSASDSKYINHFGLPELVYQDITDIGYYLVGNGLLKADYELCYYNGTTRVPCNDYA